MSLQRWSKTRARKAVDQVPPAVVAAADRLAQRHQRLVARAPLLAALQQVASAVVGLAEPLVAVVDPAAQATQLVAVAAAARELAVPAVNDPAEAPEPGKDQVVDSAREEAAEFRVQVAGLAAEEIRVGTDPAAAIWAQVVVVAVPQPQVETEVVAVILAPVDPERAAVTGEGAPHEVVAATSAAEVQLAALGISVLVDPAVQSAAAVLGEVDRYALTKIGIFADRIAAGTIIGGGRYCFDRELDEHLLAQLPNAW